MVQLPTAEVYCVYYEEGASSGIRARRFRVDRRGVRFTD
jgi:hypothetical protein